MTAKYLEVFPDNQGSDSEEQIADKPMSVSYFDGICFSMTARRVKNLATGRHEGRGIGVRSRVIKGDGVLDVRLEKGIHTDNLVRTDIDVAYLEGDESDLPHIRSTRTWLHKESVDDVEQDIEKAREVIDGQVFCIDDQVFYDNFTPTESTFGLRQVYSAARLVGQLQSAVPERTG